MNELALFAGAGGGILGGHLLGWRTVCAVEWEPYPASVLCARQNDGLLPPFPVWDDIQTFDGRPWRGIVDVVSGGFPCQDISAANQKGDGLDGERSGMWKEMARVVSEIRPKYVFVENSPMLTSRGLGRVLGDLAQMGFDAEWGVLGAGDFKAKHRRDRIWIFAYDNSIGLESPIKNNRFVFKRSLYSDKQNIGNSIWSEAKCFISFDDWNSNATKVWGMDDGMADRVDRLKAIGNGQVPIVAKEAWEILSDQR